jgi:hypothetical protein
MGSFKKYLQLNEMPLFMYDGDIQCPFNGHRGSPINGNKSEFRYDVLSESFGAGSDYQKRIFNAYKPKQPYGIVPNICRNDMKVFMWNVNTGETYAAKTEDDINFCDKFVEVMKSERSRDRNANLFDFERIARLIPEESI